MPPSQEDDRSALERAKGQLYALGAKAREKRARLSAPGEHTTMHSWGDELPTPEQMHSQGRRHIRLATVFFVGALSFFVIALIAAGFLFYYGGVSVSVKNIDLSVEGPTTIAAGDTIPLQLAITNRNPVAIQDATLEIDFPDGTRSAADVTQPYPRYTEDLGTLASGQTVTRSIKAVVFGGAGQQLSLPITLSYGASGSNAVFVKKSSYALAISSTPLSISVDTLAETVSGKPLTLTLAVRSNASVPLDNVLVASTLPFGFSVQSSSVPLTGSSFLLGTLTPGDSKTITLTGTLTGQDTEKRVFHFTVGTGSSPGDTTPAISYMTQDATVSIAAPFIATTLSINGASSDNPVLLPGAQQSISLSYANTLATNVTNATVSVQISGSAVDYNSIRTTTGFYDSSTHTITYSRDTDPSLANMAPGATGIGTFTFATLPSGPAVRSPQVTFSISVSGTRIGQSNVPETVSASATQVAKVSTGVALSAAAFHSFGPIGNTGPIPPRVNQATTYTIRWSGSGGGSAIAGATVSAVLPSYVSYTGQTSGSGSLSYDPTSRTVTWSVGDLGQGATAQAAFQVSLTPSTSQRGTAPVLVGQASFSGYDRFAGIQVTASAPALTTETTGDPGYVGTDATVQ